MQLLLQQVDMAADMMKKLEDNSLALEWQALLVAELDWGPLQIQVAVHQMLLCTFG